MSRAARQWPASTSALAAEYLSAAQVAEFTPWSVDAIEKMIRRGTLKRDLHYFQPFGQRRQLLFKRSAIVALIERKSPEDAEIPRAAKAQVLNVEKATAGLHRLLGGYAGRIDG